MDRIAIISDIHGNTTALEAVLKEIKTRGIYTIYCLGDLVGKGPSSAESVDMIKSNCQMVVKGNWDFFITERQDEVLEWHQKALGSERLKYLKELPINIELYVSGKLLRLCHADPNNLFHRVHISTRKEERWKLFDGTTTYDKPSDIVGYGDIHGAYIDHIEGKILFNVGSVGNPLDMTLAAFGVIEGNFSSKEPAPFSINIVRVPYDIDRAVKEAEATDMPEKVEYINELRTGIYRGRK